MNKYRIRSATKCLKPIKLYFNQFFCIIRIFFRKPIKKIFLSSTDIREKLFFFLKLSPFLNFMEFHAQTGKNQKLLIISNFCASFMPVAAVDKEK